MTILEVLVYPNTLLRQKAEPVLFPDPDIKENMEDVINDMLETMYAYNGVGLAGPQIGLMKRIFVMDVEDGNSPMVFINPVVKPISDMTEVLEEGCLSFPGYTESISRYSMAEVSFQDINGTQKLVTLTGLASQCAQHEAEHLDGRVLVDNVSRATRRYITAQLKKRKKNKNLRYVRYENPA